MRRILLFLGALLFLCVSCQRSEFATSTRMCKNGKVTYTKRYFHERRISYKDISYQHGMRNVEMKSSTYPDIKRIASLEVAGTTHFTGTKPDNLIASTTMEPAISAVAKNNDQHIGSYRIVNTGILKPDTVVTDNQKQPGSNEGQPLDKRKVEKLGLAGFILSIGGLVPIICLPLAILGLIFGIVSLRRIKRNPALYKGKGFAIASIILGIVGILGILWFIG